MPVENDNYYFGFARSKEEFIQYVNLPFTKIEQEKLMDFHRKNYTLCLSVLCKIRGRFDITEFDLPESKAIRRTLTIAFFTFNNTDRYITHKEIRVFIIKVLMDQYSNILVLNNKLNPIRCNQRSDSHLQ